MSNKIGRILSCALFVFLILSIYCPIAAAVAFSWHEGAQISAENSDYANKIRGEKTDARNFEKWENKIEIENKAAEQFKLSWKNPCEVEHFFTHALIAYPEKAFAEGNFMRSAYDADCLTVSEFKGILNDLYENGYALADVNEIYSVNDGIAKPKKFLFPENKKPLIISFDDMNYYRKKMGMGMNDKLVVSGGRLATFTQDAPEKINFDNENVTVLENFIAAHPDFSFRGARGIICLTGFDGILGYRTDGSDAFTQSERARALEVVEALKGRGWKFASHSYAHAHMAKQSNEEFIGDVAKWKNEVGTLVGATELYAYPYGEWEISKENGSGSEKHKALVDAGFKLFFGVGTGGYFDYAPWENKRSDALLMDRKPLDGYSLRKFGKTKYAQYFDAEKIYDNETRIIKYPN